jgi:glycosyltransferase involved in cell wall biosynthesis
MPANVSVIIPTYNYGRFIQEAVSGVLRQTLAPREIVVVDDGSTDDTQDALTEFGDFVRYIRQENQGVCAARNTGVANSSGDYIAFADADDVWLPEKLEKQMAKFAGDSEIGLVHCGMREFEGKTGETVRFRLEGEEGWLANELLLWESAAINVSGSAIVVSREAFERVGGFDRAIKVGEDWDFCYRVAKDFKVGFVPEVLVDYRSLGANAHGNVAEMELGMGRFYVKAFAVGGDVIKLKRRAYGNFHSVLAGSYFYAGQYRDFARHAALSIWNRPSKIGHFAGFPIRRLRRE